MRLGLYDPRRFGSIATVVYGLLRVFSSFASPWIDRIRNVRVE